jgi:hypothetical protein
VSGTLCIDGHMKSRTHISLLSRYLPLVEMEYQAEVEAATNRLVSTPKQKLVKQGFCLADLGGRWEQRTITGRQTATFSFVGSRATSRFNWNRLSYVNVSCCTQ